jgi:hypothetical protein
VQLPSFWSGAVVDDAFVKALLSNEGPSTPLLLPRDMSFSKYGSNEERMHMETDNQNSALLLNRPISFEQASDSVKNAKKYWGKQLRALIRWALLEQGGMDQIESDWYLERAGWCC